MSFFERVWWTGVGVTTTMLTRKITSAALHDSNGAPKLSFATRRNSSLPLMFALAALSGVAIALGDVLREHRKEAVDAAI